MDAPSTESFLTAKAIKTSLGFNSFIHSVFAFETIDSTNTYARNLAAEWVGEPTLIVAEEQTHGRGRFRREWHSERGKNLLFSLLIRPQISSDRLGVVPLCVAESVASAIESQVDVAVVTKWPNDLLVGDRKICGILVESVMIGGTIEALIVGIGVNVNQSQFPLGLNATSLQLTVGKPVNRHELLLKIVANLEWLGKPLLISTVQHKLAVWRSRWTMRDKRIQVKSGGDKLTGIVKNVEDDGSLIIAVKGKEQKIFDGEVTVVEG